MSRIVVLIDESGSMTDQKYEVINGINTLINSQRKLQEKDVNMDIVKFNTKVCHYVSSKLSKMPCFTNIDYSPNGGTALYDAVGHVIHRYKNEKNITMVINTDGMENSSLEYKRTDMLKLIDEQTKLNNWKFIYLSEDPTTVQQGYNMGFKDTYSQQNCCVGRRQTGRNLSSVKFNTYLGEYSQGTTKLGYNDWQKL